MEGRHLWRVFGDELAAAWAFGRTQWVELVGLVQGSRELVVAGGEGLDHHLPTQPEALAQRGAARRVT